MYLGRYQVVHGEAGEGGSKVYKQRHDGDGLQSYLYRWDVLLYKGRCNKDHDMNVSRNGIPRACSHHSSLADFESCLAESKLV